MTMTYSDGEIKVAPTKIELRSISEEKDQSLFLEGFTAFSDAPLILTLDGSTFTVDASALVHAILAIKPTALDIKRK